jgi:hypothetical protein
MFGYICMSRPKDISNTELMEPMAYGSDKDPEPDMLLHSRGATLFESIEEARKALKDTLIKADLMGHEWPSNRIYSFVPVRSKS